MFYHNSAWLESPNYETIGVSFNDEKMAREVLDKLKQAQKTADIDIHTSTVTCGTLTAR